MNWNLALRLENWTRTFRPAHRTHLTTLDAQPREHGAGLQVLEQGIEAATAEGRTEVPMPAATLPLKTIAVIANPWTPWSTQPVPYAAAVRSAPEFDLPEHI
ncbi:hypothetical protein [Rhodococcus sp. NPDC057529]|uniref:hypothetical protein n=1 Tax=Rhodococcus sp. NPDC057529 TaxID=3346158 RepID=UPI0036730EAD